MLLIEVLQTTVTKNGYKPKLILNIWYKSGNAGAYLHYHVQNIASFIKALTICTV